MDYVFDSCRIDGMFVMKEAFSLVIMGSWCYGGTSRSNTKFIHSEPL